MYENSLTTAPTHASLGERVRSAPVGFKTAAGSAAAAVALLGAGLGGYGIGQAVGDDPAPASLTRGSDPTGREADSTEPVDDDVSLTVWYSVPVPASHATDASPLRVV